jgi:predicted acylesterase/phospholipase RssA
LQLSSISGVSIGAFTAAIVASHPDNPIDYLQSFWKDLTVFHSKLLPAQVERFFAYFGNPNFYLPRQDYYDFPLWTSFYDLSPIKDTLAKYVDFSRIARAEVKLVVTATDIESGEILSFDNSHPNQPITIDHIIASGSLPPSYPPKRVGNRSYWDGGLFDNTPLSQLLNQISVDDASATRVIVINLFPNRGSIPKNIMNVWDRMIEIQFSNKTKNDVALAQKINKLIAAIERLQGVPAHDAASLTQLPEFADLAKYKVFDNIIAITNETPEEISSSTDFSNQHRSPNCCRLPCRRDRLDRAAQARCRYCKGDHLTRFKAGESGRACPGANGASGGRRVATGRPAAASHTKKAHTGVSPGGRNCRCYAQNACE